MLSRLLDGAGQEFGFNRDMCVKPSLIYTPLCYIPLYAMGKDDDTPYSYHGTGILVRYQGCPMMVTAEHNLRGAPHGLGMKIGNAVRVLDGYFARTEPNEGREEVDDFFDVAAIALSEEVADVAKFESVGFYPLDYIETEKIPPGSHIKFAGYPQWTTTGNTKATHLAEGSYLSLRPHCVNAALLPHDKFPTKVLSPEFHLVIPFMPQDHLDGNGMEAAFMPPGMSGGPIFVVQENAVRLSRRNRELGEGRLFDRYSV